MTNPGDQRRNQDIAAFRKRFHEELYNALPERSVTTDVRWQVPVKNDAVAYLPEQWRGTGAEQEVIRREADSATQQFTKRGTEVLKKAADKHMPLQWIGTGLHATVALDEQIRVKLPALTTADGMAHSRLRLRDNHKRDAAERRVAYYVVGITERAKARGFMFLKDLGEIPAEDGDALVSKGAAFLRGRQRRLVREIAPQDIPPATPILRRYATTNGHVSSRKKRVIRVK